VTRSAAGVVLERLVKRFPGAAAPVLDGLSLEVSPGEVFGLLGPSGSGKTTLLRIIAGFETADSGRVLVGNRVVQDGPRGVPPEGRGIGFVFQHGGLFPHLTVLGNLEFGLRGRAPADRAQRVARVVDLCGLAGLERRYPHELSGGEQQRAALARALVRGARVVMLDEPLSSVDAPLRAEIGAEVRAILRSADATAILVTHDRDEAFLLADRLGILGRGVLEQVGTPEDLYQHPATAAVARFLGAGSLLPGQANGDDVMTELGPLRASGTWPEGASVSVLLRPGDVSLHAEPAGPARVTAVTFRGSWRSYRVRLPSGRTLTADLPATGERFEPGDPVRVAVLAREVPAFPA
jgi:ABC-type Fe3+/spermidine/putrescine transport system ATPase subunit